MASTGRVSYRVGGRSPNYQGGGLVAGPAGWGAGRHQKVNVGPFAPGRSRGIGPVARNALGRLEVRGRDSGASRVWRIHLPNLMPTALPRQREQSGAIGL